MEKLHPGIKKAQILSSLIGIFFFAIFAGIFFGAMVGGFGANSGFSFIGFLIGFLILGGGFFTLSVAIIIMRYNRFLYEFRKDALYVEKGIVFKKYSTIPYERVQNVDIHRGIFARMFGYSALFIQTAGYSGGGPGGMRFSYGFGRNRHRNAMMQVEGYLPAIDMAKSEQLRDWIMKKISR